MRWASGRVHNGRQNQHQGTYASSTPASFKCCPRESSASVGTGSHKGAWLPNKWCALTPGVRIRIWNEAGGWYEDPSHPEKEVAAEPLCWMPCTNLQESPCRESTQSQERGIKDVQKPFPVRRASTLHLAVRSDPSLCSVPSLRRLLR